MSFLRKQGDFRKSETFEGAIFGNCNTRKLATDRIRCNEFVEFGTFHNRLEGISSAAVKSLQIEPSATQFYGTNGRCSYC